MTRSALFSALALLLCFPATAQEIPTDLQLQQKILVAMEEMSTVHMGMTRRDLQRMFQESGAMSSPFQRTYSYRRCHFIQVVVDFKPVAPPDAQGRVLVASDEDVITSISKPYIALHVVTD